MTTNAIDRAIARPAVAAPTSISQATAIEQSRAIAEVQAAVVVAQQCPRSIQNAEAEMRDSCGRMALANRAFYSVPNRGTGPSVHLARELARIWGNVQYGVHELRRDDEAQESEVQAFAWDVQTNTRSTRTFVNPHARMKKVNGKQTRDPLTDLGDIYLSNQNVGARAVRECIFSVLPTWFTETAQDLCRKTLEHGEGKPLDVRINEMVNAFRGIGITLDQLEQKIGRKRGQWTAGDVAQMGITYTSITREGLSKDEEFPPQRVTADEVTGAAKPATAPQQTTPQPAATGEREQAADAVTMMTAEQRKKMFALWRDLGYDGDANREQRLGITAKILGLSQPPQSTTELTAGEADALIAALQDRKAAQHAAAGGEQS